MDKLPQLVNNLESITTIKGMGSLISLLIMGVTLIICLFKYVGPLLERAHERNLSAEKESKKHLFELAKLSLEENRREILALKETVAKLKDIVILKEKGER